VATSNTTTGVVLGVLLREARSHRMPTAATLLGVAAGVAVVVAIHLASAAALNSFQQTYGTLAGAATHQITAVQPMPAARLVELFEHEDVLAVQPVVESTVVLPERAEAAPSRMDRAAGPRTLRVVGLDPFLAAPFLGRWPADEQPPPGGAGVFERFMTEPGFALVDRIDLPRLGLGDGGALTVRGPAGDSRLTCHAVDGGWSGGRGTMPIALVDLATAQELFGLDDGILRYDLILAEGEDGRDVAAGIPLREGEVLERPERRGERASTLTLAFRANLLALGFLAVLVGAFLVFNMAQFAVTRRRTLLGKLRCLGCPARSLLSATLLEAGVLGLAGGVLGVLGGRLLASALVDGVALTVSTLYGYIETPVPGLDALTVAGGLALAVATSVAATWAPARSAARTPPVLVAGGVVREPLVRWPVPLAFALVSAACLLPPRGGLVLQALAVVSLLLSVATLVPLVLGFVVRHPPHGTVLSLAMGRLQRSLARTGATAGALVMPIAMTVGITVMIGSFEREVKVWVDATIGADVYVKPMFQELSPWTAQLDDALLDELEILPGVEGVDLLRGSEVRRGDSSFLVAGSRLSSLERKAGLRVLQGAEDDIYDRLRAGAVIITEPLHRKTGLGAGDELVLEGRSGPRAFPIAAVFQDFSFDRGYALLDDVHYLEHFGETGVRNAALVLAPGVDADAVSADLAARFPQAEFSTTRVIHENVMKAFDNTFRVTWALQAIAAALALVGVLTGLLCLHLERRQELGVLRSLGSTHRTIGRLLLAEAMILVGVAVALSLPVGAVLAWILIEVVNVRSFGWSFPMAFAWSDIGGVLGLAVLAAALAGVVPWLMVRRARIAQLLQGAGAAVLVSVFAVGAAAQQEAGAAGRFDENGFLRAGPERPIVLPADHGSHPATRTEWWYLTGALTGEDGEAFHGALTDVEAGRLTSTERACRAYDPWARAAEDDLDVELLGNRLWALDDDARRARLVFGAGEARLDLELDLDATTPLLHGELPGYSVKGSGPGQASWYYSLPRIGVRGTVTRPDGTTIAVTGSSWFDHEFGSSILAPEQQGWDWFSVALDDGSELMVFDIRLDDGGRDVTSSGTLRRPDGSTRHLAREDFALRATGEWTSSASGVRYPSGWVLSVPSEDLELQVEPAVRDQEMRTPESTSVTYWEGLCRFVGRRGDAAVAGSGYVELVGYAGSIAARF
jgi:putative ABC transport system permease protein